MADPFNPYHVWLSIPAQELPANHYRLLGVPLFEASADAIDSAADRQMSHLRTFQSSKNGKLAEQLLNEVAAARVCLLDPKQREAYDEKLRATQSATTASASGIGAASHAGSASAIQRQPPRRATTGAAAAMPTAVALGAPVASAAPQPADLWNDVLGDPNAKPVSRPGSNSAKAAAAKRSATKHLIRLGIVAGLGLAAFVAFILLSSGGSSEGTLVFNWPAADRLNTTITVDNTPLVIPAIGPWEFSCPPGSRHIVADHLAYKLDAKVGVTAGQKQTVAPDWRAKAMLVLNWPLALRSGAELKIDGRVQTVSQREPLEVAVEPGRRSVQITGPSFAPIQMTATVAADGRELVSIAPPPPETAKLAFDWSVKDRKNAELTVDGHGETVPTEPDGAPLELTLPPGRHVVRVTRRGFEPFRQIVELTAGENPPIKPTWTPEQKTAPTLVETQAPVVVKTEAPLETVSQPVKKLAVPTAVEQERIAKQLESLYKSPPPGAKDPAKAQELYELAAKDGSAPADRYMLLTKGAEIAAVAGDLSLSLQGIDALDADFEINALEVKQKLLEKFINAGKPDEVAIAIPAAEQLVDQAVVADQYEIALRLATTASHAATKSKMGVRKGVGERLARRRREIHLIEPIYAVAKKAQESLEKNPADAEANATVGRWRCFYKGEWANGLPMLAKGSDGKLKSLAAEELKAPTDAEQQAHLADGWWELAQKEAGVARDSIHVHAGEIYQSALPNLASALRKVAVEKRLAEIASVKPIAVPVAVESNKPTSLIRFPVGHWVDVLPLADPAKHAVAGRWSRDGDKIKVEPDNQSRIVIPVAIAGSYDLEVELNRHQGAGDLHTTIPVGPSSCNVMVGQNGQLGGLDSVDGRRPFDDKNPFIARSPDFENDHTYHLLIKVRVRNPEAASVDVSLDGKPYLPHWEGNPSALSISQDWAMPTLDHLGLGAWRSQVTYSSVKLRMVSGHATVDTAMQKR